MSNSLRAPEPLDWLYRGGSEIFPDQPESDDPHQNIRQRLRQGAKLRVKLGIDPTGSQIHLGHSTIFRKLRAFQDQGHTAVLIIGDFTAQVGDPTGKSEVRRQLTVTEVNQNAATYLEQLRPLLDFDTPGRLEVHYNSTWLTSLDLGQILELLATMTLGQMLAKEGFSERHHQGNPVYLHEFLYPLLQGYDSVAVKADVELGGTDQKFNLAVGRDLQRHFHQEPQFGLLLPILPGLDGVQKMSKSLGNFVALGEDPLTMYSKLEKVPDQVINQYYELLTDYPLDQLPVDPRERQKTLALAVVTQYHGAAVAAAAQASAMALIQGDPSPTDNLPEFGLSGVHFPLKLFYLLRASGLCQSSSEARRQLQGGAVKLDGQRVTDVDLEFATPEQLYHKVVQLGKSHFLKLVP